MYTGIARAVICANNKYYPATILAFDADTGKASLAFWALDPSDPTKQVLTIQHNVPLFKPVSYPCAIGGGGPRNAVYMPDHHPDNRVLAVLLDWGTAPNTLKIAMGDAAGAVQVLDNVTSCPDFEGWVLDPTWPCPPILAAQVATLLIP